MSYPDTPITKSPETNDPASRRAYREPTWRTKSLRGNLTAVGPPSAPLLGSGESSCLGNGYESCSRRARPLVSEALVFATINRLNTMCARWDGRNATAARIDLDRAYLTSRAIHCARVNPLRQPISWRPFGAYLELRPRSALLRGAGNARKFAFLIFWPFGPSREPASSSSDFLPCLQEVAWRPELPSHAVLPVLASRVSARRPTTLACCSPRLATTRPRTSHAASRTFPQDADLVVEFLRCCHCSAGFSLCCCFVLPRSDDAPLGRLPSRQNFIKQRELALRL